MGRDVNQRKTYAETYEKENDMLEIFANTLSTAARQHSVMTPLGENERRRLYLEQSRLERRKAQARISRKG